MRRLGGRLLLLNRLLGRCRRGRRSLVALLHLTGRRRLPGRLDRRLRRRIRGRRLLLVLLRRLRGSGVIVLLLPRRVRVTCNGGARERHRKCACGRQARNRWPHSLSLLVRSSRPDGSGE